MTLELNKVHHYVKEPGSMSVRLVRTSPYQRFFHEGEVAIFLQHGNFWYEGGDPVTDKPSWLIEEIRKSNPKVLKECGYSGDEPRNFPNRETSGSASGRRSPLVRRPGNGGSNRG